MDPLPQTYFKFKSNETDKSLYKMLSFYADKDYVKQKLLPKIDNTQLSETGKWYLRAFLEAHTISHKEFASLPKKLQKQLYAIGSGYRDFDFISSVKGCKPSFASKNLSIPPVAPSFLSESMDCSESQSALIEFLRTLREEERLFTTTECEACKKHMIKGDKPVERLIGAKFLEQVINDLHVSSVKVSNQVLVMSKEKKHIEAWVRIYPMESLGFIENAVLVESLDFELFVTEVKSCDRFISVSEMENLVAVIEHGRLSDIALSNIIVAEDAIYLIDTEYKSFSNQIQGEKLQRLGDLLDESDRTWFIEFIAKKIDEMDKLYLQNTFLHSETADSEKSEKRRKMAGFNKNLPYKIDVTQFC